MDEAVKNLEETIQGWKDVQLTPDVPLSALVNFLNILNQRLCAVENIVTVQGPDGKMISLTDLYAQQTQELKEREKEAVDTPKEGA